MDRYFGIYGRHLGLSMPDFLALGRPASDGQSEFCMTLLALRLSSHRNGVSKLHGNITRPDVATFVAGSRLQTRSRFSTSPTACIFRSWISLEMNQLCDRYLTAALARRTC